MKIALAIVIVGATLVGCKSPNIKVLENITKEQGILQQYDGYVTNDRNLSAMDKEVRLDESKSVRMVIEHEERQ